MLYLFKYLFKGPKKKKYRIQNAPKSVDNEDDIDPKDKISLHIRGRFLCSCDAMWRLLGYQTYPKPTPLVRVIKVKIEAQIVKLLGDGKVCDILVYFKRPEQLNDLKYTEFFSIILSHT